MDHIERVQYKVGIFTHFYPGAMTTHAESINSDLQHGLTFTTLTILNTEQNQLAIKVSTDNYYYREASG